MTLRHVLAFPRETPAESHEIINDIAGHLQGEVQLLDGPVTRAILVISFVDGPGLEIDVPLEALRLMHIPYNLRSYQGNKLIQVRLWRPGLDGEMKLSGEEAVSDCRSEGLDYPLAIEASYEGIAKASYQRHMIMQGPSKLN